MAEELQEQNNPFAEFGGKEIKTQNISSSDPFAEFGGKSIDVKKKDGSQISGTNFPITSVSPLQKGAKETLQEGAGLADNSFLRQINNPSPLIGLASKDEEILPSNYKGLQDVSLKEIRKERKEPKQYYNAPVEKGVIFTGDTDMIAPGSKITEEDAKKLPLDVTLKNKFAQDYIEKIRKEPTNYEVEGSYFDPSMDPMGGIHLTIAQNALDQFISKAAELGSGVTSMFRDLSSLGVQNPELYDKEGNLTEHAKSLSDYKNWINDPAGTIMLGLNGIKSDFRGDLQYNGKLPDTMFGKLVSGGIGIIPDIAAAAVLPETELFEGAGLLSKAGKFFTKKFPLYLGGSRAIGEYGEQREAGKTPEEAAGAALKGGVKGYSEGLAMELAGILSGKATGAIMKPLEKMGITGLKGQITKEGLNTITDAIGYGALLPVASGLIEGKMPTEDEYIQGVGLSLPFSVMRVIKNAKTNNQLNDAINKIEALQGGISLSNFVDATTPSIIDVYNSKESAAELNIKSLEFAKKARETTDLKLKQDYIMQSSAAKKAANVKQIAEAVVNDKNGFKEFKQSNLPEDIKQSFLDKAAEVYKELNPIEQQKTELGKRITQAQTFVDEMTKQMEAETDPVKKAELKYRIDESKKILEKQNNDLIDIIAKQAKEKEEYNKEEPEEPTKKIRKPSKKKIQKDIDDGNLVSFTYTDESEVPESFKNNITSTGETNGIKFVRVSVPKSIADYELGKNKELLQPLTSVSVAPYYDTQIKNVSEAANLRESEGYKKHVKMLSDVANKMGLKLFGIDNTIGGFKNAEGNEITEISNRVKLNTNDLDIAEKYAAIVGAMANETQEATIAAKYVEHGSPNQTAIETEIKVDNLNKAIDALKKAQITDYEVNENDGTIKILDFSNGQDLDFNNKVITFANELDNQNIKHESEHHAIESRYVDPERRSQLLKEAELKGEQQEGGPDIRDLYKEASAKSQEFIKNKAEQKKAEEKKNLANKIRSLKTKKGTLNLLPDLGLTKTVYDGALEFLAKQIEKGTKFGKAIQDTIEWIDNLLNGEKWNKELFSRHAISLSTESAVEKGNIQPAMILTAKKNGIEEITHAGENSLSALRENKSDMYISRAEEISKSNLVQGKIKKYNSNWSKEQKLKWSDDVYSKAKSTVVSNLLYLYDNIPENVRTISKLWYDGANKIAKEFANKYDITHEQAAAVIASQSPQKPWFDNLHLAQFIMDFNHNKQNTIFTKEAFDYFKKTGEKYPAQVAYLKELEKSIGKKYSELSDYDKSILLRHEFDTKYERTAPLRLPTGHIVGRTKANASFSGYDTIVKAISILNDGSPNNISDNLGGASKVRNFNNNIIDPTSDKFATIDTHAMAAAYFLPLGSKSPEVKFDPATYSFFHDAYSEAAKQRGVLPREMQSITWEGVKSLFPPSDKTETNKSATRELWNKYKNGEISIEDIQKTIKENGKDLSKTDWSGLIDRSLKEGETGGFIEELPFNSRNRETSGQGVNRGPSGEVPSMEGTTESNVSITEKGKKVAEILRKAKLDLGKDVLQSNIVGLPIAIYNAVIETIATAIESGTSLADAIALAIEKHKLDKREKFNKRELIKQLEELTGEKVPLISGIKNVISDKIRTQLNLPTIEIPNLGAKTNSLLEGKKLVDSGEINPEELVDRIINTTDKGTNVQEAQVMQYYTRQLNTAQDNVINALANQKITLQERLDLLGKLGQYGDKLDQVTEANILSGGDWGLVGNIRQEVYDEGYNPVKDKAAIKQIYDGNIPENIKAEIDKANKERNEALIEMAKREEIIRQQEAQLKIQEVAKTKVGEKIDHKKVRADLLAELKEAKDQHIKDLKDKGIQQMGGIDGVILTPKMIKIIGKIAADYVKEGYENLEDIIAKVYDEVKGLVPNITKKDIRDTIVLHEANKVEEKATKAEKQAKIYEKEGIPSKSISKKLKEKFESDDAWVKARQRLTNANLKIQKIKSVAYNSKKNVIEKSLMWFTKAIRFSILFSYDVLTKLASATVIGGAIKRIPEQLIGSVYSKVYKGIAEKAPIEGFVYAKSEVKFAKEFLDPVKFAKNTINILKEGETELSKRVGGMIHEDLAEISMPGEQKTKLNNLLKKGLKVSDFILSLPGNSHMMIKDPLKRATYYAAYENSIIWAEKNGLDINDPLVINTIENAAYKRANYEIFLEDNELNKKFKSFKASLEESGTKGAALKALIDFAIPISTVPTNIVRRVFSTSPLGLAKGIYQAEAAKKALKTSIDNLETEQADAIMRQLKQGTLGTALWMLGWFGYASFGGLYTKFDPNKKREEGALLSDEMEINGKMIPKPVQHALPLEVIQMAATSRRIYENYIDNKGASSIPALTAAGLGSIGSMVEQVPVISTPVLAVESIQDPSKLNKLEEDWKNRWQPRVLQQLGIIGDSDKEKFIKKHVTGDNVYRNELNAYDKSGVKEVSPELFLKYKEKLFEDQSKRLKYMYEHGAIASDAKQKPFSELTADEKTVEIARLKRESTDDIKEKVLGKKRKTIPEIRLNSKISKARKLFEKKYKFETK